MSEPTFTIDVDNVKPIELLPEGPHQLEVAAVQTKTSKAGNPMLSIRLDATHINAMADDTYHFLMLPTGDMTEKERSRRTTDIIRFIEECGVKPFGDLTQAEGRLQGKRIWCTLKHETGDDNVTRHRIVSIGVPKDDAPASSGGSI